jgi:hypothetical protein
VFVCVFSVFTCKSPNGKEQLFMRKCDRHARVSLAFSLSSRFVLSQRRGYERDDDDEKSESLPVRNSIDRLREREINHLFNDIFYFCDAHSFSAA